jgi:hypothetical protein
VFTCGLQIRVVEGADRGRTFPLDNREVTIGRARNPGDRAPGWVLLNDPMISRIHADLVWDEEQKAYKLMHRSDTNPTEINGAPASDVVLKIGDLIKCGKTVLDLQSADFRFGGVEPERITAIQAARRAGHVPTLNQDLAFRDPKRENEQEGNTTSGARKIALSTRSKMFIEVLSGKQQGQKLPVTGFAVQVGGSNMEDLPESPRWWDQEVILDEATLPFRCMSWHWRELQKAFEVAFIRDVNLSVTLERRVDGTEWIAELPTGLGASVLLRPNDLMYIGQTAIQLVVE